MSVKNLELPELLCPFPSVINKNVDMVNQHTLRWTKQFELLPETEVCRALEKMNVTDFAARCHPEVSLESLKIASDYLSWLFTFDDYCEELSLLGHHTALLRLHAQMSEALDVENQIYTAPNQPFVLSFRDVLGRIFKDLSPQSELKSRFLYHTKCYLDTLPLEAKYKSKGIAPDLKTYIEIRRDLGAVYPCFDLVAIFGATNLELEIFEDPKIQQFEAIANDIVIWSNDILGLRRDVEIDETFNLVMVLRKEYGLDLQEAIQQATHMHEDAVKNLLNLANKILSTDANAEPYIKEIYSWIGGHIAWYKATKRYDSVSHENTSLSKHASPNSRSRAVTYLK